MESEDRLIDLLRAYVKDEAPADLWQVVSTDLSSVLRKIIALSAECQRAKLQLQNLKKDLKHLEENFPLPTHMRMSTVSTVQDSAENVEGEDAAVSPWKPEAVFLAPGHTARLDGVPGRPFLHWCRVCNEVSRSKNADPAKCPRRECRSAFWRRGTPPGE